VNAQGIVVAWNDVAVPTFDWTAAKAVGRALGELIVPEHHRAHCESRSSELVGAVARARVSLSLRSF